LPFIFRLPALRRALFGRKNVRAARSRSSDDAGGAAMLQKS